LATCLDTCKVRVRFWAPSQYPVLCSIAGPSTAGKELRDAFLLKTPVAVRLYVRRSSDLAQTPDLPSIQLCWIGRRLHWQVGKKMAGSLRTTYRCISFSFIGKTGPEVFNRICEDIVVGGNSVQHRFDDCSRELGRGWYPSNGTATRRSSLPLVSLRRFLSARFEKEAEVALRP